MVNQITRVRLNTRYTMIEDEHRVEKLMKWLPAGPTSEGGERKEDLVQFVARHGGIRTIPVNDLIIVR